MKGRLGTAGLVDGQLRLHRSISARSRDMSADLAEIDRE